MEKTSLQCLIDVQCTNQTFDLCPPAKAMNNDGNDDDDDDDDDNYNLEILSSLFISRRN